MSKCASCGLLQAVPMPEKREVAALYHEDFNHFTPYIEQLAVHHAYFRQKLREIARHLSPPTLSGLRLLDIGCATGVLLIEATHAGAKAVGIDISVDAVAYCRREHLLAYAGSISSLGKHLKPESFDVVTAFQVIEHERESAIYDETNIFITQKRRHCCFGYTRQRRMVETDYGTALVRICTS